MSWWDHFVADAVPTAVMGFIVLAALGASHLVAVLFGVGWEWRRRRRADAARQAGYNQQIELTVPILSACARDADR